MSKIEDLTGKEFGRLTVLGIDYERTNKHKEYEGISRIYWKCKCTCGNEITVYASNLMCNNTKSCGCLRREVSRKKRLKQII